MEQKIKNELDVGTDYKSLVDKSRKELFILTKENISHKIVLYHFNQDSINNKFQAVNISIQTQDFETLKNSCISCLSQILVILVDNNFHFFDTKTGSNLNTKQISESSPSKKKEQNYLTALDKSDDFIFLDDCGTLNYIEYDPKLNDVKIQTTNLIFDSFKINKNLFIGYDKTNLKLFCFDLDITKKENSFSSVYFSIDLEEPLNHYGLSLDNRNMYVISNKKNLKFYQINKNQVEKPYEILLYSEVMSVLCTNQYITLSMRDNKVISFLINDKNNPDDTYKIIQNLPSRREPNEDLKKKNDLVLNKFLEYLNDSSDEEDVDEILKDENTAFDGIRDKIKKCKS